MFNILLCKLFGHKFYEYRDCSFGRAYLQTQCCVRCGFDRKIHPYLGVSIR